LKSNKSRIFIRIDSSFFEKKKMAGRFGKKPFMKVPPKKTIYPRPYTPSLDQTVVIEEEHEEPEEHEEYEESKYFRFTSIRTLVWINFILVLLLAVFFMVYVFTRPSTYVVNTKEEPKESKDQEEPHRISFNLVPATGSDGKWTVVSLKNYGFSVDSIIYLNVCCTKEGAFFCNPSWVSVRGHDATIKIHRQDLVGSMCQLIWLD
jgi:hypothetical protein